MSYGATGVSLPWRGGGREGGGENTGVSSRGDSDEGRSSRLAVSTNAAARGRQLGAVCCGGL